jgi:hypothetical protein
MESNGNLNGADYKTAPMYGKMPTFEVDFNELFGYVILLSQKDIRKNIDGQDIQLMEGLEINITEENYEGDYKNRQRDDLFASGNVIQNTVCYFYENYPHVKWLCKINSDGVRHISDFVNDE